MTLPANALPFGNRLPSADDRQIANQLRRILASQKAGEAKLQISDPKTVARRLRSPVGVNYDGR